MLNVLVVTGADGIQERRKDHPAVKARKSPLILAVEYHTGFLFNLTTSPEELYVVFGPSAGRLSKVVPEEASANFSRIVLGTCLSP